MCQEVNAIRHDKYLLEKITASYVRGELEKQRMKTGKPIFGCLVQIMKRKGRNPRVLQGDVTSKYQTEIELPIMGAG